jgi:hypothetical protein
LALAPRTGARVERESARVCVTGRAAPRGCASAVPCIRAGGNTGVSALVRHTKRECCTILERTSKTCRRWGRCRPSLRTTRRERPWWCVCVWCRRHDTARECVDACASVCVGRRGHTQNYRVRKLGRGMRRACTLLLDTRKRRRLYKNNGALVCGGKGWVARILLSI